MKNVILILFYVLWINSNNFIKKYAIFSFAKYYPSFEQLKIN